MVCMITALLSSVCFLVGYITYHARVGEKSSGYTGWIAGVYFPHPGLARSAGVCDAAVGHYDACSGFSSPMGPAQANRALDDPDLAVRVGHRSSRLLNALPMVPSTGALTAVATAPRRPPANPADVKILRSTAI